MRIIIISGGIPGSAERYLKTTAYTLDTLRPGDSGIIQSIVDADTQTRRLMVLGLVEGAVVEAASAALGGDPLEFRLFGCAISLRREQARRFVVVPVDGSEATV